MMLSKLPILLKENNAKLFIKYDGERNERKYTIRLLHGDINCKNLGGDTDSPCSMLTKIFEESRYVDAEEVIKFFNDIINIGINSLRKKFGDESVVSVIIDEKDGGLRYTLHIQTIEGTRHFSDENYKQLCENIMLGKI